METIRKKEPHGQQLEDDQRKFHGPTSISVTVSEILGESVIDVMLNIFSSLWQGEIRKLEMVSFIFKRQSLKEKTC
jgi:hypothetical protein